MEPVVPEASDSAKEQLLAPASSSGGKRKRSRRRRLLNVALTLVGLLAAVVLVVTQSGVLRLAVAPRLGELLGCQAECGRVTMGLDGRVQIRDLELSATGIDSEAATFLRAPVLAVGLDWGKLIGGKMSPTSLEVQRPRIRISQGPDFSLNVASLKRIKRGGAPGRVPAVVVTDGVLELGEHWPGNYEKLAELRVLGAVRAEEANPEVVTFSLVELQDTKGKGRGLQKPGGMKLDGSADLAAGSASMTLTNVNLAEWSQRTAPQAFRGLWQTMALAGTIEKAAMSYAREEGISARFDFQRVNLNIPLAVVNGEPRLVLRSEDVGNAKLLEMREVSGFVSFDPGGLTADLDGSIGGLKCGVEMESEGTNLETAPLKCIIAANGFKVEEQPDLMPLAPEVVRRLFRRFSGPTAEGNGTVEIVRGPPTEAGPDALRISGFIDLRNGRAGYEKFPYPISGIEGHVQFNSDRVEITRITGVGPSGAKLVATGEVKPPRDNAAVAIDVKVTGIALDHDFRDALIGGRQSVYAALFNEKALEELRVKGLVRVPGDDEALAAERVAVTARLESARASGDEAGMEAAAAELARVERTTTAPLFELGGLADLDIRVRREEGPEHEYVTRIDLRAPKAGVIVPSFPYPTVAENVLIHIDDHSAEIPEMKLAGLTGATGVLSGRVDYQTGADTDFSPRIKIDASAMPVDELLIHALPESKRTGDLSVQDLVRGIGIDGTVSGSAVITPKERPGPDGHETAFRVDVNIAGLTARPGAGELVVSDLNGAIVVSDTGVETKDLRGRIGESELTVSVRTDAEGVARAQVASGMLDLSQPVEELVAVLAPDRAARMREVRVQHAPKGRVAVKVDAWDKAGEAGYRVELSKMDRVEFDAIGGRFLLDECAGTVALTPGLVTFEDASGRLSFNDDAVGRVELAGSMASEAPVDALLNVRVIDGRFESALARTLAGRSSEMAAEWMRASEFKGRFDALVTRRSSKSGEVAMSGRLEPKAVSLVRRGQTIGFPTIEGGITFDGTAGTIDGLKASAEMWSFGADGVWSLGSQPSVDVTLGVQAQAFSPELRAALPLQAEEALREIELDVRGGLSMPGGKLIVRRGESGAAASSFTGTISFMDLEMDPAVSVKGAQGNAAVEISGEGDAAPKVNVAVEMTALKLAGVTMSEARAKFESREGDGAFAVPSFEAKAHGGVLTGDAVVFGAASTGGARSYEVKVDASGLDFGGLLADLRASAPADAEGKKEEDDAVVQGWRGEMDGSLSIAGVVGDRRSRTGRGIVRIQGTEGRPAEVMRLPGVMPLLKLSNLQAPTGEPLDFAHSEFHFEGDRVVFDALSVQSKSLSIEGDGVLRLPEMKVALRFNTRSLNRVAVLSDLFEGMRNELVTTVVTGTVYDPEFKYEQLSETREMLDDAMSGSAPGTDGRGGRKGKKKKEEK